MAVESGAVGSVGSVGSPAVVGSGRAGGAGGAGSVGGAPAVGAGGSGGAGSVGGAPAVTGRGRVLDSLCSALADEGVEASMESLATRAGVSRMTLYRYFGTRQQLLIGVLMHEGARHLRKLRQIMEDEAEPFPARVVNLMLFVVATVEMSPVLRLFVEQLTPAQVDALDAGGNFVTAVWQFMQPYFEAPAVRKTLRAEPAPTIDWTLRQILLSLSAPGLSGGDSESLRQELDTFFVPSIFLLAGESS